jgi:hypothetical protein
LQISPQIISFINNLYQQIIKPFNMSLFKLIAPLMIICNTSVIANDYHKTDHYPISIKRDILQTLPFKKLQRPKHSLVSQPSKPFKPISPPVHPSIKPPENTPVVNPQATPVAQPVLLSHTARTKKLSSTPLTKTHADSAAHHKVQKN